jgi:hypothetical protein
MSFILKNFSRSGYDEDEVFLQRTTVVILAKGLGLF